MTDSPNPRPEVNERVTNVSQRLTVNVPVAGVGRGSAGARPRAPSASPVVFELDEVSVFYGNYEAVRHTSLAIAKNQITALRLPTRSAGYPYLRSLNRMNPQT